MNAQFFLKLYALTLTFLFLMMLFFGFQTTEPHQIFDEITVERINIIEPDGSLKMVISNADRQHPGMFDGEPFAARERPPGLLFFNEEQDEVGGLVFRGNKEKGAGMVLSFDQYKNDQVMQLQYQRDQEGNQQYGIDLWDRTTKFSLPRLKALDDSLKQTGLSSYEDRKEILSNWNDDKPFGAKRLFTGKNFDQEVGLFIRDEYGNERIKIFVDENNKAQLVILDAQGKLTKDLME